MNMPHRRQHSGHLVLVVGPSGAGKDTLIDAARCHFATDHRLSFPLRVITRAEGAGERHIAIDTRQFEIDEAAGLFLFSWRSHGLAYGISTSVREDLDRGRIVVVNVSRTVIAAAEAAVENVTVMNVVASPEARAARIKDRGRESDREISTRLTRAVDVLAVRSRVIEIRNDGPIALASARFIAVLDEITRSTAPIADNG